MLIVGLILLLGGIALLYFSVSLLKQGFEEDRKHAWFSIVVSILTILAGLFITFH